MHSTTVEGLKNMWVKMSAACCGLFTLGMLVLVERGASSYRFWSFMALFLVGVAIMAIRFFTFNARQDSPLATTSGKE